MNIFEINISDIMIGKVVLSHGRLSHPFTRKLKYLSQIAETNGFQTQSIDYTKIPHPDIRVNYLLQSIQKEKGKIILVGSSMGGYVSAVASGEIKPAELFLLSPDFGLNNYKIADPTVTADRVEIVHGWNDDVVPVEISFNLQICINVFSIYSMTIIH
jgi:hypothetical protein